AGQRDPAEGPLALAEERPDVRRDEARVRECVLDAGLLGLSAQVVPVVEGDRPALAQGADRAYLGGHRGKRAAAVLVPVGRAPPIPPSPAVRTVRPRSDPSKCWRASSANVSYVPCRIPWHPM